MTSSPSPSRYVVTISWATPLTRSLKRSWSPIIFLSDGHHNEEKEISEVMTVTLENLKIFLVGKVKSEPIGWDLEAPSGLTRTSTWYHLLTNPCGWIHFNYHIILYKIMFFLMKLPFWRLDFLKTIKRRKSTLWGCNVFLMMGVGLLHTCIYLQIQSVWKHVNSGHIHARIILDLTFCCTGTYLCSDLLSTVCENVNLQVLAEVSQKSWCVWSWAQSSAP